MSTLFDIIPVKYRRLAYAIAMFASAAFGIWQVSDGNWQTFIGSLFVAAVNALAAANAVPVGKEARPEVDGSVLDEDPDDDLDDIDDGALPGADYPMSDESDPDAEFPNSTAIYEEHLPEDPRQDQYTETAPIHGALDVEVPNGVSGNVVPDHVQRANDDLR